MFGDEHGVLYATNESLHTTSGTSDVLYIGELSLNEKILIKDNHTLQALWK